jgi:hypothetical protein
MVLNTGESEAYAAAIDPPAGYAYFGTYSSPANVVKIDLGNFSLLNIFRFLPAIDR